MRRRSAAWICAAVGALSACTGSAAMHPQHSPVPSVATPRARCAAASRITNTPPNGPEVTGTGHGATLYGLIQTAKPPPLRVGTAKIVWRMTGSGPLRLTVTDPRGRPGSLTFGPEAHGGSNYDRPGQEWGAGYRLTSAGCWHLHAQRTHGSGDVYLQVAAA